jgi:hypothetical protein
VGGRGPERQQHLAEPNPQGPLAIRGQDVPECGNYEGKAASSLRRAARVSRSHKKGRPCICNVAARSLVQEEMNLGKAITVEPETKGGVYREGILALKRKSPAMPGPRLAQRAGGQTALRFDSQEYSMA